MTKRGREIMKFMEKLLVGEKVEWKKLGKIKEIRKTKKRNCGKK